MKNKQEEANWFWELTTKWWFFPVFYVLIIFILYLIVIITRTKVPTLFWESFIVPFYGLFITMPFGLVYFVWGSKIMKYIVNYIFVFFFYLLFITSIITICYYKAKKNKILKWLIITWIILLVLSFVGCAIGTQIRF